MMGRIIRPEIQIEFVKDLKEFIGKKKLKPELCTYSIQFTSKELEILKNLSKMPFADIEIAKETELQIRSLKSKTMLNLSKLRQLEQILAEERETKKSLKVYLHEVIAKTRLILPENEILERNPQLEARCEKLRAQQERREYQSMTKNVDSFRKHIPEDTIAHQMKLINKQLIGVVQLIFSVAAGFAFGFIGVELIVGNLDFGFRLLLGIICALIIALAEIYFLAKQLNENYDFELKQNETDGQKIAVKEKTN